MVPHSSEGVEKNWDYHRGQRDVEGEGVLHVLTADHELVDEDVDPKLRGGGGAALVLLEGR